MKSTIIYLGIALLSLSTSIAKNSFKSAIIQDELYNQIAQVESDYNNYQNIILNSNSNNVENLIFNPDSILYTSSGKSIEEIIAENKQIIEETTTNETFFYVSEQSVEEIINEDNQIIEAENVSDIQPIFLEKTIENTIQEDNAIIESTLTTITYPLDFEKINKQNITSISISKSLE